MSQIMTDVNEFVRKIKSNKNDDEMQHDYEDQLHVYIIKNMHILTIDEIQACQKLCAEVEKMTFARWCA